MDLDRSIQAALDAHEASNVSIGEIVSAQDIEGTPVAWSVRNRKRYPRLPLRKLGYSARSGLDLGTALEKRRSVRKYVRTQIPLKRLESLLSCAMSERANAESGIRPYASAGARYPCELYLGLTGITSIDDGLYYYDPIDHAIVTLLRCDPLEEMRKWSLAQEWGAPSVVAVITSVFHRILPKYGARGYRYCLIEAGEIAQNLCLAATGLEMGSCLIGGFDDAAVAEWIDISWELEVEAPILVVFLGEPLE